MELTFKKMPMEHLRQAAWEARGEEQTQEIRLPDSMPDIGKVLGAWGQVVIRGKEWHTGGMNVSGGVMAWVLYVPEDGSDVRSVEGWLPFQLHWDFPDTERDGSICVNPLLRSVDARGVSARKLMVRASVSVMGQALEPGQVDVFQPENVPEDVQLLRRSYPVLLPVEAGEKAFVLEEDVTLPASGGTVEKLLCYELQPELTDRKLMADKVVFRGAAVVHMLYRAQDGTLKTWDHEVPFSQFSDLEKEYDPNAQVRVTPALTSLELDKGEDGSLHLKAGLIGQYVIYDRRMVEVAEDAYSPGREVQVRMQPLLLPTVLDSSHETLRCEKTGEVSGVQIVDTAFRLAHPSLRREEDRGELSVNGSFQVLFYDASGNPQCENFRWEDAVSIPSAPDNTVNAAAQLTGRPQAILSGGSANMRAEVLLDVDFGSDRGIPMLTGLTVGELKEPEEPRPSLILRRAGQQDLWSLAKRYGSTVDAIRSANALEGEPEENRLLLIPIA